MVYSKMSWINLFFTKPANPFCSGQFITTCSFPFSLCNEFGRCSRIPWKTKRFADIFRLKIILYFSSQMCVGCLKNLWEYPFALKGKGNWCYEHFQQFRVPHLRVPCKYHNNQLFCFICMNFVEKPTYQAKPWECIKDLGPLLLHCICFQFEWRWGPCRAQWKFMSYMGSKRSVSCIPGILLIVSNI